MIRLLVIAALVCVAVRWATGAWPWQWLSTGPSPARDLAKARRLLQIPPSASPYEIKAA